MKITRNALLTVVFFSLLCGILQAQIEPVEKLKAEDMPNDAGGTILLTWGKMPFDSPDIEYLVLITDETKKDEFTEVEKFKSNIRYMDRPHPGDNIRLPFWTWRKDKNYHYFVVDKDPMREGKPLQNNLRYYFKIATIGKDGKRVDSNTVNATAYGNIFNWTYLNKFIFMILFALIVLWFISKAKKKELFLRKIPGLVAIDEAIGRATEMGKPIYYLTGRLDLSSVSTIAATVILGEVAKKVATYDAQIKVPHTDPVVFGVCQEITKEAYTRAGRPDAYRNDSNFFITTDQFGYTAAVDGMMSRERPAACFYMGYYYAEALLFAETGAATGAIQIAGTDAEHQLPFFVAACDYTLMGEELYATSAYLSKEPILLGTLRGQDMGKAILMLIIVIGTGIVTIGTIMGEKLFVSSVIDIFRAF